MTPDDGVLACLHRKQAGMPAPATEIGLIA